VFLAAMFWMSDGIRTRADSTEQVIFSGNGTITTSSNPALVGTPFGFWIWCEAEASNPYIGECKGAMYVYALRLTKHVEDAVEPGITEPSPGIYVMNVASRDGTITATLQN